MTPSPGQASSAHPGESRMVDAPVFPCFPSKDRGAMSTVDRGVQISCGGLEARPTALGVPVGAVFCCIR
jgi:hypothetical protein